MMFTELIISQAKTVGIMAAAGVMVETLWQLKVYAWNRISKTGGISPRAQKKQLYTSLMKYILDVIFWIMAAVTVSMFLYYSAYGKLSLYALMGFLTGLLFWKLFLNKALKFTLL